MSTREAAVMAAKLIREHKLLAADKVRPAQIESYVELFGDRDPLAHPALAGRTLAEWEQFVAGTLTLPKEERAARKVHYAHLSPKSHIWLRGIAATALAIYIAQEEL